MLLPDIELQSLDLSLDLECEAAFFPSLDFLLGTVSVFSLLSLRTISVF